MGSTLTTFDGLLKERYLDSSIVEKLVYPDNVLFAMLEKRGDSTMQGDTLPVPFVYGNPQGTGGVFGTAQTNSTNAKTSKWQITAGSYFGVVEIGDKVLEASRTNLGAFLENKKVEIDGLYEQAGENLSIYTWGNGGQYLGRIAAIQNTNELVLVDTSDAGNFELDMELVASANDGSDSSHTLRSGNSTVANINRATGVITITVSEITSLAAGDYLFRQSDFFGDSGNVIIKGVQAFVTPNDSPGTLWGISNTTRATDVQRFSGCRPDSTLLSGKTIDERIKMLCSQMTGRFKAKMPTAGFLHPEDFQTLDTLMSARGVRALEDTNTKFGFMKIDLQAPGGRIPIYTDRHCPRGHFFAFRMANWWISSMGELLHPQKGDGMEMLRRDASTDYEFRLISYPLLACNAPLYNGRCSLTV